MLLLLAHAAPAAEYLVSFDGGGAAEDTTISSSEVFAVDPGLTTLTVAGQHISDANVLFQVPGLIGDASGSLPSGSVIQAATLTFYAHSATGDTSRLVLHTLDESWTETEATWWVRTGFTGWATTGAGSDSRRRECGAPVLVGTSLTSDVTTCVGDWAGGLPNHGWVLSAGGSTRNNTVEVVVGSSEGTVRPTLWVQFSAPDRDGDGWDLWQDCAEGDASAHPGAADGDGDGVDDDCDGAVDEDVVGRDTGDTGARPETGADTGAVVDTTLLDEDRDRWARGEGDCDDADPAVYPGRDDGCDGVDGDCDGQVDEDCAAAPAGTGCACGEGAEGTFVLPFLALGIRRRRRASSAARPTRTSPS